MSLLTEKRIKPAAKAFKFPKFKLPSEALKMAKRIIRDEHRWTQENMAVRQIIEEDGIIFDVDSCRTKSEHAVAFCALGAVSFVNGSAQRQAESFLREAGKRICVEHGEATEIQKPANEHIFFVNDALGHEETLAMFDIAIRAAKKAEIAGSRRAPKKGAK